MEEKLKELLALQKDRQELIRLLTGEKRPISKCRVYALVDELKKRKGVENEND